MEISDKILKIYLLKKAKKTLKDLKILTETQKEEINAKINFHGGSLNGMVKDKR